MFFGTPFSIKFRDLLNILTCNNYNAKNCFEQFQASHLGIKNQYINHLCLIPLLGHHFPHFLLIFLEKTVTLRGPSTSNGRQNGPRKRLSSARMVPLFILIRTHFCVHGAKCSQDPPNAPRNHFWWFVDPSKLNIELFSMAPGTASCI